MVEKELLSLLLQDFPEGIAVVMACFALLKLRFEWKKITILALLWAITNLVRLLPIAFGMHTIILTITLIIYLRFLTRVKLLDIFKATILCLVIVISLESIYSKPLLNLTHLSFDYVVTVPILRAFFSLPYELVLLVLALFLNHKNKKTMVLYKIRSAKLKAYPESPACKESAG